MAAAVRSTDTNSFFTEGNYWSDFFRITGYIPLVSSTTGPVRAGIGLLGVAINALAIPIFAALNDKALEAQSVQNLKNSALWVARGFIESKPFIGNATVWSHDALQKRLHGEGYRSGLLHNLRFIPFVSMVTGALRTIRGATGAIAGSATELFFKTLQSFEFSVQDLDRKITSSHKFAVESALEIPQGLIEMIPVCDGICPPLAKVADRIEQKKINMWQHAAEIHQE